MKERKKEEWSTIRYKRGEKEAVRAKEKVNNRGNATYLHNKVSVETPLPAASGV